MNVLPFGAGGVTEMLGRWGEEEGSTESSGVCDFPAPLAHGLGEDCEGAAGLRMDGGWAEKRKRETEFN